MLNNCVFALACCLFLVQLVVGQDTGTVSAIKANLRGTPSGSGVVITTVTNGESFEIVKDKAPWYLIQTSKYVGWIHGNGISLSSANGPLSPTNIERVFGVRTAMPTPIPVQEKLYVPTTPPEVLRYETGTNLISEQNLGGRGSIQISNGTSVDAVAKLVDNYSNKTIRLVYIRASSVATVSSIRPGNYVLKFSLGTGYDSSSGKFTKAQSFSRFDEILGFYETRVGDSIRWKDFEVTLNAVVGGNASTSPISASDFEDH